MFGKQDHQILFVLLSLEDVIPKKNFSKKTNELFDLFDF